jgi:L-2-hydroxyglutarate oxidase
MIFDYCIIGGGLVGFASAMELIRIDNGARVLILEKEAEPGQHQTSHNSGVIHAGIYYEPGSLKAKLCREGLDATKAFCRNHAIPFEVCGKLIVATNKLELERLNALHDRAISNGLNLERIDRAELVRREPNITGVAALFSPDTAIVDFGLVCRRIAEDVSMHGAVIRYGMRVTQINDSENHVEIACGDYTFNAKKLIVCGGLQADRLARMAGLDIDFHVVPFRGEYYQLPKEKSNLVKHLIYPAPDPSLPILGIHLTRMIDGGVTVGSNAVIGFAREGYSKLSFSARDTWDFLKFSGFWSLMFKHRSHAIHELAVSFSKSSYVRECQKYCPSLCIEDLRPYRAGIRAQVVSAKGEAVHDFLFKQTERMLHVYNAPSPAATSAIPIRKLIARRCLAEAG